jgi:hypothetical protein
MSYWQQSKPYRPTDALRLLGAKLRLPPLQVEVVQSASIPLFWRSSAVRALPSVQFLEKAASSRFSRLTGNKSGEI